MEIKFTPAIEDPKVQECIITDIDTDGNAVDAIPIYY